MFAYVILHYRTMQLTIDCVAMLRKVSPTSSIVVVDNGSDDGSGETLRKHFATMDSNIVVLLSNENLGFARGNNLGYNYVRTHFNPDFVVVMNNDVMISQPDFEDVASNYIIKNSLDVCGPDILTPDNHHQNPLLINTFTTLRIVKQMCIDTLRLLGLKTGIMQKKILNTYKTVSTSYKNHDEKVGNVKNCIVHGSCVIFSSNYLSKSPYAFVPVTFLYGEELILFDYCQYKKFTTGICPNAQVLHLGGKSTKTDLNARDRQIFNTKCTIKSMSQLVWLRLSKRYLIKN